MRRLLMAVTAGVALAACGGDRLVTAAGEPAVSIKSVVSDEGAVVSPYLTELDGRLAAAGSNLRVAKAEIIVDSANWTGASTVLIANDRARGIGLRWVEGDPRRDGRVGVSYAFDPVQGLSPFTRNPDGSGLRQMPFSELDPILEQTMTAWRGQTCSTAPIARVAVPGGVDPDLIDQLVFGSDGGRPYAQVSDIVQGGWQRPNFFTAIAGGPSGNNIIGVTFSFWYVDATGTPTDIDRDGNRDTGLAEIYYNTRFAWGSSLAPNVVDFYSILTHETGHSLGLGHFGKVFFTKKALADGTLTTTEIKYAPKALMNAVYVTGRSEIEGTDNSSFCQIWASVK